MKQRGCVKLILVEIFFISISLLVLALGSRSYCYSQKKAYSAFDKGNYEEALKQFNERDKKNPKDIENLYNKGVTEYKLKKYDDSIESFASVASSTKDKNLKTQSLFNLGNAEAQVSNFDGAIASYEEALKLDPDNERIKTNLEYVKQLKEQKQNQKQDKNNQDNKNDQNQNQDQNQGQNQDQNNKDNKNDQNQNQDQNQESQNDQNQNQDQNNKNDQNQNQDQNQESQNDQNQDQKQSQAQNQDKDKNSSEESRQNTLGAVQEEKSDEQKLKEKQAQAILNRVEDKAPEYMNKLNSKERTKMKNKKVDKDW